MNTKNNKRRRESQEKIEQAFITLLQDHEIETITVSAIINNANVNRSTFYANYTDIYDLADKVRERVNLSAYEYFKKNKVASYDEYILRLFKYIKENPDLFKSYRNLYYNVKCSLCKYDVNIIQNDTLIGDPWYHAIFFKSGIIAMAEYWLERDFKESPEEMLEILKSQYKRFT